MAKNAASQMALSGTGQAESDTQAAGKTNAAGNAQQNPGINSQGAQFVYAAATVANILCSNLTQAQVNLLGNFFSVITTSIFAILTVENPRDVTE